uniref:Major facilitator superfamily (MFS) profile domain-containing protein n=1 Tax=Ditylum brightwellii TaxID=49249 RepID=A0A7S4QKX4_9STRA|mmetsp:Transcript_36794/g.56344  ORF Transcript_36794/g.56344 Transcript_36794/m.56344 type:complete len:504 (+) Transcript_36794:145-1656(+)
MSPITDDNAHASITAAAKNRNNERDDENIIEEESCDFSAVNSVQHADDDDNDHDEYGASCAAVLGNVLEWYDFSVFGYFSDIIGEVFFPPNQKGHASLIESFAVFGLAFLVRPIGGLILGLMGDTVGRKSALETSIFFMAAPTVAMGFLPSYSKVGWISPALLIIVRLLQGFSVGGQLTSSIVFKLEQTDQSKWGRWSSIVFAFSNLGVAIGSLFSYVLRETLSKDQLNRWGWRLPFWCGIFGALPALYLKYCAKERAIPEDSSTENDNGQSGDRNVLRQSFSKSNFRPLISCMLLVAFPAATYYIVSVWLVIFMEDIVHPPVPHAFAITTAVNIAAIFLQILCGCIADYHGNYAHLMIFGAINLAWLTPLLLHFIAQGSSVVAFFSQLILASCICLYNSGYLPWIVKSFPPSVRLTSMSFAYNLSVGIFGGFSPAVATALVSKFGSSAPGYMVTILAFFALLGLCVARKPGNNGNAEISLNELENEENQDSGTSHLSEPLLT